jgi:hypothetical protein
MMEEMRFSETSVLTKAARCNIPEDDILHSHRREDLRSYLVSFLYRWKTPKLVMLLTPVMSVAV